MKKIWISGIIGDEVFAKDIEKELNESSGEDILLYISSPGGFISDGIVMYNLIRDFKRHNQDVKMYAEIKGMAASMASYLAMNPAFDKVSAEDNAIFMIHNAAGYEYGDYRAMNKMSDKLNRVNDMLSASYSSKTGKSKKEIRSLMDDETYYFGNEIMKSGFVDNIIDTNSEFEKEQIVNSAKNNFFEMCEKLKYKNSDSEQLAAMLIDEDKINTPAVDAGENKMEVSKMPSMNLEQFLNENPAAKVEIENGLNEKIKAGIEKEKNDFQNKINEVSKFVDPSAKYSDSIKNLAVRCLREEISLETFRASVVVIETMEEQKKSEIAAVESDKLGDTPAEQTPKQSIDGSVKNPIDLMAEVERMKNHKGVEVK